MSRSYRMHWRLFYANTVVRSSETLKFWGGYQTTARILTWWPGSAAHFYSWCLIPSLSIRSHPSILPSNGAEANFWNYELTRVSFNAFYSAISAVRCIQLFAVNWAFAVCMRSQKNLSMPKYIKPKSILRNVFPKIIFQFASVAYILRYRINAGSCLERPLQLQQILCQFVR